MRRRSCAQQRYAFSDQEVKQYFPEDEVLDGLFSVTRDAVRRVASGRDEAPVWHPDVRFFRIERDGALVGAVLSRPLRARRQARRRVDGRRAPRRKRTGGGVQTPVAYLTCNFRAAGRRQARAASRTTKCTTLFHEFGHGLHHMLTRVDELGVSGINGVEWDAVELPQPVHGELLLGVGRAAPT